MKHLIKICDICASSGEARLAIGEYTTDAGTFDCCDICEDSILDNGYGYEIRYFDEAGDFDGDV